MSNSGVTDEQVLRVMGLDYGSKTVGIAISDLLGVTAQPVETVFRKKERCMGVPFTVSRSLYYRSAIKYFSSNSDTGIGFEK